MFDRKCRIMKSIFTLLSFISVFSIAQSQTAANILGYKSHHENLSKVNLNGQWRGSFNEITPNIFGFVDNTRTTYVLELEVQGSYVKGYSYTYFNWSGKRYYTICRVTGSFDRRANDLVVTEVERIKYNTPPEINNYFQVHHLQYVRGDDNTEYLRGEWRGAPGQKGDMGNGETILSRKMVSRTPFAIKLPPKKEEHITAKVPAPQKKSVPSQPLVRKQEKPTTTIVSGIPADKDRVESLSPDHKIKAAPTPIFKGYENRKNIVVNTIKISEPVFQVDLYDNGEIDGDSISVFFNGKLILSHQRLTDKPITLTLSLDKNLPQNIITMYAENLGTIPPNTALMIVRDGDKRHEVRMESDMGKSGTVIFTHDDH